MAYGNAGDGGDVTYRKIFVGGLAWETQSPALRRYFEQFGDILEAVVISDKNTGRSKGYGFVTFRDPLSAERACSNPNPLIDGRKANCNLAYYGQTRPPPPSPGAGRLRPTIAGIEGVPNTPANYGGSVAHYQPFPYTHPPGFLYPPYGMFIIVIQVNSTFKDMGVPLLQSTLHTHMDNLVFHLVCPLIVIKPFLHIQCRLIIWCLMVAFLEWHHLIMLSPFPVNIFQGQDMYIHTKSNLYGCACSSSRTHPM